MSSRKRIGNGTYRTSRLTMEWLEARLALHGDTCVGSACPPDLHLDAVQLQSTRVNEAIELNLYTAGATVVDLDVDENPTGDTIRLQLDPDDNPSNATLTSDGVFRWTPTQDQVGLFEFIVIAIDSGTPPLADAEVFMVEVRANSVPDLAEVPDVAASVNEELVIELSATDPDSNQLTFALDPDQSPEGATVERIDNNNARLRWTPSASDAGTRVAISLLVVDDGFPPMSDSEVVFVDVMSVAAVDDTFAITAGTVLTRDAATGVLANDSDSDNDPLTATIVTEPTHGSVVFAADGSFEYTPDANFQGTDTFRYEARDNNGDHSSALVTITVNSTPESTPDTFAAEEDITLVVPAATGLLANDVDADGDTLTASLGQSPAAGTLSLNSDGSFSYIPAANFSGEVEFTYFVSDGLATSSEATVTINVSAVNDVPVAVADAFTTDEDTSLVLTAGEGVLANDQDEDDTELTATLTDVPDHGNATLNVDGALTYTPAANFHGTDTFAYTISDGETTSPPAIVTVTILAVNDVPVALADTYSVNEGGQLLTLAVDGVLANDTDEDGDTLSVRQVTGTTNGVLDLNSNGSFTYIPNIGFDGTDTFTYAASDGAMETAPATVTITITNVNLAPTGGSDAYFGTEDQALTVNAALGVLINDSDSDGDTLTATVSVQPTHGSVVLTSDGSFVYTPEPNFHGDDEFRYQASDGIATSDNVVVTITINAVNDAPVAQADAFDTQTGTPLTVNAAQGVLANDTDVEGSTLSASVVDQPTHGTVTLALNGGFTYTPAINFSGPDSFSYRATDGTDESAITVVTISVSPTAFGEVTPGSFEDAGLSGIRTDLQPGAAPIIADHVVTAVDYSAYSNPPTYGPHHGQLLDGQGNSITPRPTGVYTTEQPDEDLVHNLEHGHVWISYNPTLISPADLTALEQLVTAGGTNNGVILTPRAANTDAIAVASWARLLTLSSFDSVSIRTFIEANRGKSPEGFIVSGQKSSDAASETLDDGLQH